MPPGRHRVPGTRWRVHWTQTAAGVEDWSQKATSSHPTVTSAGLPMFLSGSDSVHSLGLLLGGHAQSQPQEATSFQELHPDRGHLQPCLPTRGFDRMWGDQGAKVTCWPLDLRPWAFLSPTRRFQPGVGLALDSHPPTESQIQQAPHSRLGQGDPHKVKEAVLRDDYS